MSAYGLDCYRAFNAAVKLEAVVRQQAGDENQSKYLDLLAKVSKGKIDENDWRFLLTREYNTQLLNEDKFKNAVRLYADNNSVIEHNRERLSSLKMPIVPLKATHSNSSHSYLDSDQFGGLSKLIYLSQNSRVMLNSNLWTETGLVNGADGIVKDIIYPRRERFSILNTQPEIVLVDFEKYSGPSFFMDQERKNTIPIPQKTFTSSFYGSSRTQIPLRLNYAMTFHKSQGCTLDCGILDFGKVEFALGLSFVGLSRFKSIYDFLIAPVTFERLAKINTHKSMASQNEFENELSDLIQHTIRSYRPYLFTQ